MTNITFIRGHLKRAENVPNNSIQLLSEFKQQAIFTLLTEIVQLNF